MTGYIYCTAHIYVNIYFVGIPKSRREELWFILTDFSRTTTSPSVVSIDGPANETDSPSFDALKDGQTEYQQAIFIDISEYMMC